MWDLPTDLCIFAAIFLHVFLFVDSHNTVIGVLTFFTSFSFSLSFFPPTTVYSVNAAAAALCQCRE